VVVAGGGGASAGGGFTTTCVPGAGGGGGCGCVWTVVEPGADCTVVVEPGCCCTVVVCASTGIDSKAARAESEILAVTVASSTWEESRLREKDGPPMDGGHSNSKRAGER
jgi:hypothetical protein